MAIWKSMLRTAPDAETLILWTSVLAGLALSSLPYEARDGGGLVPTVAIFRDRPGAFYALVLSLVSAGSASAGAIIHRGNFPGYARLCRRGAATSLAVAAAAVIWAAAPAPASWWWGAGLCAVLVVVYAFFAVARSWGVGRRAEGN